MTATIRRERQRAIDALRGAAVALMLADHLLVVVGLATDSELLLDIQRHGPTRLAMPMFLALSGWLLGAFTQRRRLLYSASRARELALLGVVLSCTAALNPGPFVAPDILLVCALLVPLHELVARRPVELLAVALVLYVNAPLGWDGYEPSLLLAWLCVGVLAHRHELGMPKLRAPLLAAVGRRALPFYVGHLLVLHAVWLLVRP